MVDDDDEIRKMNTKWPKSQYKTKRHTGTLTQKKILYAGEEVEVEVSREIVCFFFRLFF